MVYNELDIPGRIYNKTWLQARSAQVLEGLGQYEQATLKASEAMEGIQVSRRMWESEGWAFIEAMRNANLYNAITGKVLVPKGLNGHVQRLFPNMCARFEPGSTEAAIDFGETVEINSQTMPDGRERWDMSRLYFMAVAPDGQIFRSLKVYPIAEGKDATVFNQIQQYSNSDVPWEPPKPIQQAVKEGLAFDDLPRTGLLLLSIIKAPKDQWKDPKVTFRGLKLVAGFDPVPASHGAIDISCCGSKGFLVQVDGRFGIKGPGVIGLLPPGRHELTVTPSCESQSRPSPYAKLSKQVQVVAGKTTSVELTLPWRPDGADGHPNPWASWTPGTLVGKNYPDQPPCLRSMFDTPCLLGEPDALRVIWSYRGDLWSSSSSDGKNFAAPARLEMPISSGWIERSPRCLRDESGKYLLVFRSDRNAQYQDRVYVCWSRDFQKWSAPVMVMDKPMNDFRLIQDDRGRFIWVDGFSNKLNILVSRDAYRWDKLAQVELDGSAHQLALLQRDDGQYELFVLIGQNHSRPNFEDPAQRHLYRFISKDGITWQRDRRLMIVDKPINHMAFVDAAHVGGRSMAVCLIEWTDLLTSRVQMFRERPGGDWESSQLLSDVCSPLASMAHHSRWGYMLSWNSPQNEELISPPSGPYLIRGQSVDRFFGPSPTPASLPDAKAYAKESTVPRLGPTSQAVSQPAPSGG